MDAVVTATTTMAQGPEASTSTDTRRQGEGKTSYNCKSRKTMEEFVTVEYMKYLFRCCTEDGYGYGAYQIIVADAADAVSVNFSGRCNFLQI